MAPEGQASPSPEDTRHDEAGWAEAPSHGVPPAQAQHVQPDAPLDVADQVGSARVGDGPEPPAPADEARVIPSYDLGSEDGPFESSQESEDFEEADEEDAPADRRPPVETTGPLPGTVEALAYRPASPRSIEEAVLEVKRVVDALQKALQDMEEVLELIEDAEQQKGADEREIHRLQELLRQMTQVRERVVPPPPVPSRHRPDGGEPHGGGSHGPSASSGSGHHGAGGGDDRQGARRRRRGRGRGPRGSGRPDGERSGGGYREREGGEHREGRSMNAQTNQPHSEAHEPPPSPSPSPEI